MTGVALFWALNMPLPFLFGPMFACLVAALWGTPLQSNATLSMGARTVLGVAIGSSITTAVILQIPTFSLSLAGIPVFLAMALLIGLPYFRRVAKLDLATAYYAAMPGSLQDVLVFGREAGADVRALSLIHATRILFLFILTPLLILHIFDLSLDTSVSGFVSTLPWYEGLLMIGAALIGWKGGERLGIFGAAILGPLFLTAILSLSGWITHPPPTEALMAAQFFIGIGIGTSYVGITRVEIRHFVIHGTVYVILLTGAALACASAVTAAGLVPLLDGFLAFAPGGQAEMTMLTLLIGADIGYVVLHHIIRMVLIVTCAPLIWSCLVARMPKGPQDKRNGS